MKIINESIDNIFVNPENPRHNPTLDDITALNELIKDGGCLRIKKRCSNV